MRKNKKQRATNRRRRHQWTDRERILLVVGTLIPVVVTTLLIPPISQNQAYHHFADNRHIGGIPNFWNVITNLPFLIIGGLGLIYMREQYRERKQRLNFQDPSERWPYLILFLGIFATGFGSAYYHLAPNDVHLVWDRLPMTFGFMAILATQIMERIDRRAGQWLLWPLVILGTWSVYFWYRGDLRGAGDLRFYADVQFYPMLVIPLMVYLFPSPYTRSRDLAWVLFWYVLAKLLEWQDHEVYHLLGGVISGHSLKHLAAAMATGEILRHLQLREVIRRLPEHRRSGQQRQVMEMES